MSKWVERAQNCRIHTIGRISGGARLVTVWFAHNAGTLYVLSRHGERADWVQDALVETDLL